MGMGSEGINNPKPLDLEEILKEWKKLERKKRKNADKLSKRIGQTIRIYKPALEKEKLEIVKQRIKSAVQGLMEDIDEIELKNKTLLDLQYEIKQLIKKWFPNMVSEND